MRRLLLSTDSEEILHFIESGKQADGRPEIGNSYPGSIYTYVVQCISRNQGTQQLAKRIQKHILPHDTCASRHGHRQYVLRKFVEIYQHPSLGRELPLACADRLGKATPSFVSITKGKSDRFSLRFRTSNLTGFSS